MATYPVISINAKINEKAIHVVLDQFLQGCAAENAIKEPYHDNMVCFCRRVVHGLRAIATGGDPTASWTEGELCASFKHVYLL